MTLDLHVPVHLRRGWVAYDEAASVDSAVRLIEHMCADLGLADLAGTEVLDVGCGVKFTQAFLNRGVPVKRYVGVDVSAEIIEFLQASVDDPRFEYHRLDAHNERYNPQGKALDDVRLPVGDRRFDLICLFSVFTHLAPHDYRAMLQLLRGHVAPSGRLYFSLYIDDVSSTGHGLMDAWARSLGREHVGTVDTFRDLDPAKPLLYALYSAAHAKELVGGTGWDIISLLPPTPDLQHHFVCAPAG